MHKNDIPELRDTLAPELKSLGYELIDLEFVKEQGDQYLRFFIDSPDGIDVDDCERASRMLSEKLDVIDPIDDNYYLEVSSPDLSRPLKTDRDLERNIGELIELTFYAKRDGSKKQQGTLVDFDDKSLQWERNGKVESIDRKDVAKIMIAIVFS